MLRSLRISLSALLGTYSTFLVLTDTAQALTYTFTPSSINVPSGSNQGAFTETISFNTFSFDFTAPSSISSVTGTARSTVRVVNYTFTAATYDPVLQLLTFTGPGPTSPNPDFSTSRFVLQLDAPLVDSVTPPDFPTYQTISFGDYCRSWQDQGNTRCRTVGSATLNPIQPIPFGLSGLALAPLVSLGWYRRRLLRRNAPSPVVVPS